MYAVNQAFKCLIHGFMYTVHSTACLISLPSHWGMKYSIEIGSASRNDKTNDLSVYVSVTLVTVQLTTETLNI